MANYCYTVPILPGGVDKMKNWISKEIVNNKDHDQVFKNAGISREQVWVQRTPGGDFAVVSFEVKDAGKAFETLVKSQDNWAKKFRNFLSETHGVDFSQPMPLNEQVVNWQD
jgi:hypothetical protein